MSDIKNMSKRAKDTSKMPPDSEIISKETNVRVEEIENGFLICKNTEIRYKVKDSESTEWMNIEKKYYSETDPLTINIEDKSLADMFD